MSDPYPSISRRLNCVCVCISVCHSGDFLKSGEQIQLSSHRTEQCTEKYKYKTNRVCVNAGKMKARGLGKHVNCKWGADKMEL